MSDLLVTLTDAELIWLQDAVYEEMYRLSFTHANLSRDLGESVRTKIDLIVEIRQVPGDRRKR